jgi:hypothetical protein
MLSQSSPDAAYRKPRRTVPASEVVLQGDDAEQQLFAYKERLRPGP